MIFCKELNKSFKDKKDMFLVLKQSKEQLIAAKKAVIKCSDPVLFNLGVAMPGAEVVAKEFGTPKEVNFGDYVYPVINTINYLDSHKDVHVWGLWDKSAKDQNGKVYYIINHDLAIGKVISYPKEVDIMIKEIKWSELGRNYAGKTQALIFKAKLTDKSNDDAYKTIKGGEEIQNSIRMMYVRLAIAINSGSEDFKEEKRVWDKYSPDVVNKEALEDGYFWAVLEAKIYLEGSAVLFGSNDVTPVMYEEPKIIQPLSGTESAPSKDTRVLDALTKLSNSI